MWDTEYSNEFGDLKLAWFWDTEWKLKGLMWYYWPAVVLELRLMEERGKWGRRTLGVINYNFLEEREELEI